MNRLPKTSLPVVPVPEDLPHWEPVSEGIPGNFSVVYRARPKGRGDRFPASYALKMLHPHWREHPLGHRMFHQEREAGSSVSHPHVVPVLDSILQQDLPFLIMPWLEGQTLRTHLEAGTTFSLSHALWIARQATEALNALAESRWVHNDIKPENLFLSPMGHLTLIDLGFATEFSGEGFSQQLGETPPLGTLNYMAPEKADPQCPVIPSSDLYSLGIVLFEMLAGMPPRIVHRLEDLSSHCVTREHIHAMLPPSIPSKVADLIAWMTHPCPSQRVDSARKLLRRWYELEIESFRGRPHTPRPPHFQSVTAEVHS